MIDAFAIVLLNPTEAKHDLIYCTGTKLATPPNVSASLPCRPSTLPEPGGSPNGANEHASFPTYAKHGALVISIHTMVRYFIAAPRNLHA